MAELIRSSKSLSVSSPGMAKAKSSAQLKNIPKPKKEASASKSVSSPMAGKLSKAVDTPELDKAVGNTPSFTATKSEDFVAPSANEEEEKAGFGNLLFRSLMGGAASALGGVANDVGYRTQMTQPSQAAENAYWKSIADGTGGIQLNNEQDELALFTGTPNTGAQKAHEDTYKAESEKPIDLKRAVDWGDAYNAETQRRYADIGAGKQIAADVASAVGGMLPSMSVRGIPVVGKALSQAMLFSQASGAAIDQALADGATNEGALNYGAAVGAAELATERMFGGLAKIYGAGAADDIIATLATKIAKSPKGQKAITLILNSFGEGVEEGTMSVLDPALKSLYNNKSVWENLGDMEAGNVFYDMLIGTLTGGVFEGSSAIAMRGRGNNQTPEQQEQTPTEETPEPESPLIVQQEQEVVPEKPIAPTEETPISPLIVQTQEQVAAEKQPRVLPNMGFGEVGIVGDELDSAAEQAAGRPLNEIPAEARITAYLRAMGADMTEELAEGSQGGRYSRAVGYMYDYVRQGLYSARSAAQAIIEAKAKHDAGEKVSLVQTMDRAIELDGKTQPAWYQEQYHPTPEQEAERQIADKRYQAGVEKYKDAVAKRNSATAPQRSPLLVEDPDADMPADGSLNQSEIFDPHGVGAAPIRTGQQVPTQSHLTEQNVHIPEGNKPDINIGTHERLDRKTREIRARAGFVVDSDNNIINADDVAEDIIDAPVGSLGAIGVEQAELTVDILYQQNKPDLAKKVQERVIAEETDAGQVLRTAQDHMANTPEGKVKSALKAVEKARSHKKNRQQVQEADASVDEIVAAVQAAVPNAATVSTDQTAYDLIRSIYQAFSFSDKLEGRNWVVQMADELAAKIEHGAAEATPRTKTMAQQMVSDLVRLTKDAAPKAAKPATNTKANTETFQNFLANRAEYEQAVAWAQRRIAEDYADSPEMLAAFNSWISNAISLRNTVSSVMRENGVKIKDILLTSWENKSAVVDRLVSEVLEPLDLTDAQAHEAAQIIYSQFWTEVTSGSTAAIEKFLSKKTVGKSSKEAIQDMDNLEAFEREEYVGPVQEKIIDKIIQENKATIREILRESGTSKWLAVIQIAQNTLVDAGLTAQQTAAFAERIYDRLWSEIESQSRTESERYAKDTPKPKTEPKPASQLFAELANLGAFGHPDLMNAVYTKAVRAVIKENSAYINSVLGENAADQDRAVQAIKDYVLSESNLDPDVLAQTEQILDLAIRNEIFERNARYLSHRFGKKDETQPTERVSNIDKFMELFNRGAFGKDTIRDAVYEHLGLPVLTAAETKRIYDLTALAKSVQAQDPRLAKEMMCEANRIIAAKIPNTVMDRLNAWRYLAMLFNVKTHIRNIESTAAFMPVRMVKDAVGTGLEVANGTKDRTKSILNIFNKADRALYQNAASDYEVVEGEIQNAGKYDERDDIQRERQILSGIAGDAAEINSKALDAEDRWFSKPAYAMALAGWLKANNITAEQFAKMKNNPTDAKLKAAREYAIKEAQKATYRDLNAFSELVSSRVNTKHEKVNTVVNTAIDAVVPFKRTPANIIVRATEYSPVYLAKGIWEMRTKVKSGEVTAAEALDHIASGLTGTALMGLGALLAHFDLLTASAGDDEQAELDKLRGAQAYALNVGGTSYTIDWLAPESLMLFTGCEVYHTINDLKHGEATYKDFADAIMGLTDPMLETSMLSGINDMLESLGYSDATIPALAGAIAVNYVSSFLPTLGGQIERSFEGARQETYRHNDSMLWDANGQHTLGSLGNKIPIPGVEYGQIDYVDAWGRTQEYDNPLLNALNQFVNPSYVSKIETTVADQVIQDLLDNGQSDVVPERRGQSSVISVYDRNGKVINKRHLTREEYVQFNKISGQMAHELVTRLANNREFLAMDYATKADVVRDIYTYCDKVASLKVEPSTKVSGWNKNAMASSDPLRIILDRNADAE